MKGDGGSGVNFSGISFGAEVSAFEQLTAIQILAVQAKCMKESAGTGTRRNRLISSRLVKMGKEISLFAILFKYCRLNYHLPLSKKLPVIRRMV